MLPYDDGRQTMCNGSAGARGAANVVDRRGAGIVPIGIESFNDIYGRPDVVCEPDSAHETNLPAIVCEAKFEREAIPDKLQAAADAALTDQALRKRYAHGLSGNGAIVWSVVFDNHKHVAVAYMRQ